MTNFFFSHAGRTYDSLPVENEVTTISHVQEVIQPSSPQTGSDTVIRPEKLEIKSGYDGEEVILYGRMGGRDGMEEYAALTHDNTSHQEHETEHPILPPTSGSPIDPHNTREYIPERFSPVATLSQCTHDGRHYYDEANDFSLEIPEGAISEGESITIDIGVTLHGPFQYPEGVRPVSSVFWFCVRSKKFFHFLKPIIVTIPHFLYLKDHDNIKSLGMTFLKGDHEMNSQKVYQLQLAKANSLFEPYKQCGVLETTHFCTLCISGTISDELIRNAMFCVYAVIPRVMSPKEPSYAYFFITFLLPTCIETVKKQIRSIPELQQGYKKETRDFQFHHDELNPAAMEIVLPQSPPDEWMVGLMFRNKVCIT